MRRCLVVAAVTVAAATLTGLTPAGGAPAGAAGPGTRLWVARFQGTGDPNVMAVSPHGGRVFVAGASYGGATGVDYKTVAYSGATGRQLWASRYSGPWNHADYPTAVAVSPDGATVFVTGYARGWGTYYDYATVAYNAATGRQLWASRYTSPGKNDDAAWSVAVSPDGAKVFVTGSSGGQLGQGWPSGGDYATVAYRAATGKQLWTSRYNGPIDSRSSAAVSPAGATVFVTGTIQSRSGDDMATVAYMAATGKQLWASRYNGAGNGDDSALAVAVGPDGATVFVTGTTYRETTDADTDYATVAYRAASGKQLWASRYTSPANGQDGGFSVAVSPDGGTVFVTGRSTGRTTGDDYATLAYRAATGKKLWASRYDGTGRSGDYAYAVAVSPDGATVYVTGIAGDGYATVAYRR
jgi:DNA-binding beta-propeller fold protein YncE